MLLSKDHDWTQYSDKHVAITCSADAIVPTWAYMLVATKISPFATTVIFGDLEKLEEVLYDKVIDQLSIEEYKDKKIVIKGCSKIEVPKTAYVSITALLQPHVSSIMFGEPCSTVPLYKARKNPKA